MSDYNLNGLNPRDFEHLTQSLALEVISKGVTPFGDGPDGGREATFAGLMDYPSISDPWSGYLIIQSKFKSRPSSDHEENGKWILNQLKSDLKKFEDPKRDLQKPDYYIIVTNIILTPVQATGTKDKVFDLLEKYKSSVGYKAYDVWDYDKLCRLIDTNSSIRESYTAFVTPGDVLSKMMGIISGLQPDFDKLILRYLQHEIVSDQFVKLEQAGHNSQHKTLLAQVFVDLPASTRPIDEASKDEAEYERNSKGILREILQAGSQRLRRSSLNLIPDLSNYSISGNYSLDPGRFVIIGGPGQGKSTVGQFTCQAYRAALLKDSPKHLLSPEASKTLDLFCSQFNEDGLELPTIKRFPFRVVLDQFATDLANGKVKSLLGYILDRINHRIDSKCKIEDLRKWLASYPWIIVLDGLDEVPASSNRKQVLEKVADFWTEVSTVDADVLVVATTRPQGYNEEFSPEYYNHRYLVPFSKDRALKYANKLAEVQYGLEPDRRDKVLMRLNMACDQETTRRLMRSPLQVTIMATLVDRIGQPPQERWRLFHQYYEVIYQRETERDIQTSRILQQRKTEVNAIHHRVGLLLQKESEKAGRTESRLPADRFHKLVYSRIEEEGHEGVQIEDRAKDITEAALQRLVFLVGLQEDRIGFEIRSLQEFMAAEALMDGKEELVRARLESIAPISHWRNVFLFAAGKCFSDRQYLRDMVVQICEQLNDQVNDKLAGVNLAGSRLALDILKDGVAREQPKYARSLARLALQLIDLGEVDLCRSLGSIYEPSYELIYNAQISLKLKQKEHVSQIGAWSILIVLVEHHVEWAIKLAEENWTRDVLLQEEILLNHYHFLNSRWALEKFIKVVPHVSPSRLLEIPWGIGIKTGKDVKPAWLTEMEKFSSQDRYEQIHARGVSFLKDENLENVKLILRPISFPSMNLDGFQIENLEWAPYISFSRFSASPSHETLAKELYWLSNVWDPSISLFNFKTDIAWPLAACLIISNNKKDLKELGDKVAVGLLGTTKDWIAAEHRWKSEGVQYSDLLHLENSDLPFDDQIAIKGFPFISSFISNHPVETLPLWSRLIDVYESLSGGKMKTIAAQLLFGITDVYRFQKNKGVVSLAPDKLKEILIRVLKVEGYIQIPSFLDFPKILSKKWILFFDWLGRQQVDVYFSEPHYKLMTQLHVLYEKDPNLNGILHLLSNLSYSDGRNKIKRESLLDNRFTNLDSRIDALVVRVMQGGWKKAEAMQLAKLVIELARLKPFVVYDVLFAISRTEHKKQEAESFLLALSKELSNTEFQGAARLNSLIDDIMRSRKSFLNNQKHWSELGLPVLP